MSELYKIGDVLRITSTNKKINNRIFLIRIINRSRTNTEVVLMDQVNSNFKYFLNISPSGRVKDGEVTGVIRVDKIDISFAVSRNFIPGESVDIIYKSDDENVEKITGEIVELIGNTISVSIEGLDMIYIDLTDLSNMPFKLELNTEKNKIVDLEEWIQFEYDEEVIEEKKRYDFNIQKNDMKNSISNLNGVSETQIKIIDTTIARFVQLREQFSEFEGENVTGPKVHIAKPLVNAMETFNQKLYWIIACCAVIKKIYDCGDIKSVKKKDVTSNITSDQEISEEIRIISDYESNRDVTYTTFVENINAFSASYLEPDAPELYKNSVLTNVTSVVNNDGKLFSNVAKKDDGKKNELYDNVLSKKRFLLQNYNSATYGLISVKLPNGTLVTNPSIRTESDTISVNSVLTLPKIIALFSRINLFNADIMTRAKLNLIFLQYSQFLTRKTSVNTVDITPSTPQPETGSENFYSKITHHTWKQSTSAYPKCLPKIIPDNYALFENIIEYAEPGVSLYAVVELLEPYMVYYDNITFDQYSKMRKIINSNILKFKNRFQQKLNLFNALEQSRPVGGICIQGTSSKDVEKKVCGAWRNSIEQLAVMLKIDCAIKMNNNIALSNAGLKGISPDAIKKYIDGLKEGTEKSKCDSLTQEQCISNPDCISDKDNSKKVLICNSFDQQFKDINDEQMYKIEDEIDQYIRNDFCVTKDNLKYNADSSDVRFDELLKILNMSITKYNNYKYRIGESAETLIYGDYIILSIRDKILKQADVKKYPDIIKFVEKFTRRADITMHEDPNWLYCSKTNTKLLPSFLFTMATAYVLDKSDFNKVVDNICGKRGVLSDDNSEIIDQHSGYVIRSIDLNAAEDFDENGKIITTRQVVEIDPIAIKSGRIGIELDKSNPNVQSMIKIINQLSATMGVSLPDVNFIVSNADTCMRYLSTTYKTLGDDVLLMISTLIYLFISLQTTIPSIVLKSKIPSCHKSLDGFPITSVLSENSKYKGINVDGIVYLVCIAKTVILANKETNNWWSKFAIVASKEETMIKIIATVIETYVLPNNSTVIQMINMKQIYNTANPETSGSKKTYIIPFLPPLMGLDITNTEISIIPSDFYKQCAGYIKTGNVKQFESINAMYCKMTTFGSYVVQLIQSLVSKEKANMLSMSKKIYIENSCCPTGLGVETLNYFNSIDNGSILSTNNQVKILNDKLNAIFMLSKAMIFFDNKNTKEQFPLLSDDFTEDTKYRTLVFFCNYGSNKPMPAFLKGKCLKKPEGFNSDGTVEDKIKSLKEVYAEKLDKTFEGLTGALNDKNLIMIKNNGKKLIVKPVVRLLQILPYDVLKKKCTELLQTSKSTTDKRLEALSEVQSYLEKSNIAMKKTLMGGEKLSKKEESNMNDLLGVFDFPGIKESGYVTDDICKFVVFAKNTIRNLTRVFPSIIIKEVNNEKVIIPKYLKLSSSHEKEIQKFVSEYYDPLTNSFSKNQTPEIKKLVDKSAQNQIIMSFMDRMKNLEEVAFLTEYLVPKYDNSKSDSKSEDDENDENEYNTLNGLVTMSVFKFYLYNILIDIVKSNAKSLSTDVGAVLKRFLSTVLKGFLETTKKSKKCVEYDYVDIVAEVFKSSISEREEIKKRLRDMNKEERVVETQLKNLKLGRWGKASRKGFFEYDADFRDEEAAEALDDPVANANQELFEVDDDDNGVLEGEEYAEGGEFEDDGGDYEDN